MQDLAYRQKERKRFELPPQSEQQVQQPKEERLVQIIVPKNKEKYDGARKFVFGTIGNFLTPYLRGTETGKLRSIVFNGKDFGEFLSGIDSKPEQFYATKDGGLYSFAVQPKGSEDKYMVNISSSPSEIKGEFGLTITDMKKNVLVHAYKDGSELVFYSPTQQA